MIYCDVFTLEESTGTEQSSYLSYYTTLPPFNLTSNVISSGIKLESYGYGEVGEDGKPTSQVMGVLSRTLECNGSFGATYNSLQAGFENYIGYYLKVNSAETTSNIPILFSEGSWKIRTFKWDIKSKMPFLQYFSMSLSYYWENSHESMVFQEEGE